jgi:fumarate reductase flavoprotein subunit
MKMKKSGVLFLVALAGIMFGCAQSGSAAKQTAAGSYTGTAQGFDGEVRVTLEIKDRVIVSATAVGDHETAGIGTLALDFLPGMIVSANSVEVDAIAGATVTSQAVLGAAAQALGQAGLTNADLKR